MYLSTKSSSIAAITAAELLLGVELATKRRRDRRRVRVEAILLALPVQDYDLEVARVHASLMAFARRAGTQRGAHDLIIAATALTTSRTVLTTDPTGFEGLPGVASRGPAKPK